MLGAVTRMRSISWSCAESSTAVPMAPNVMKGAGAIATIPLEHHVRFHGFPLRMTPTKNNRPRAPTSPDETSQKSSLFPGNIGRRKGNAKARRMSTATMIRRAGRCKGSDGVSPAPANAYQAHTNNTVPTATADKCGRQSPAATACATFSPAPKNRYPSAPHGMHAK